MKGALIIQLDDSDPALLWILGLGKMVPAKNGIKSSVLDCREIDVSGSLVKFVLRGPGQYEGAVFWIKPSCVSAVVEIKDDQEEPARAVGFAQILKDVEAAEKQGLK